MNTATTEPRASHAPPLEEIGDRPGNLIYAFMNNDLINLWSAKDLPARLDVATTAKLLGFAEHDIQVLMMKGKLKPLGDPAPNAHKWFAAVDVVRLAGDVDWLHKATKEVFKYWKHKRSRLSPDETSKIGT